VAAEHPGQVRTLVAHEPPAIELLPDSAQVRAQIEDIYDTYRAGRAEQTMQKFMTHAGLGAAPGQGAGAPRWKPSAEQMARMRATTGQFLAHLIRPTTRYRPDIEALRRRRRASWSPAGPPRKGSLPTVRPWHSPASSARP
jgi:clorobiocin/coumermycin A biosynthesis protein CloN7/CouN7